MIGTASEIYTSYEFRFTKDIAKQAETGPATVIIAGMGLGMLSTLIPGIVVVVSMWMANELAGVYGVALAAAAIDGGHAKATLETLIAVTNAGGDGNPDP